MGDNKKLEAILNDESFKRFARGIAGPESNSVKNPNEAANTKSTARGKYQFLTGPKASTPEWERRAGLKREDWLIKKDDDAAEKARKAHNQELLMAEAYKEYKPQAPALVKLSGGKLSNEDAMALIHYKGHGHAKEFIKTGKDLTPENNVSIDKYLTSFRKAAGNKPEPTPQPPVPTQDPTPIVERVERVKSPVEEAIGQETSVMDSIKEFMDKSNKGVSTKEPDMISAAPRAPKPSKPASFVDTIAKPTTSEELSAMRGETNRTTYDADKEAAKDKRLKELEKEEAPSPVEEEVYKTAIEGEEQAGAKSSEDSKIDKLAKVIAGRKEKISSLLDNLKKSAGQLEKSDRDYFLEKFAVLKAEYEANKKEINKREVIEGIALGLAQMAAGWYGMKHNRDMSGVKFSKKNWDAKYSRSMAEFRSNVSALDQEIGLDKASRREAKGEQEFALRSELSLLNQDSRALKAIHDEISRADEKETKRLEKEAAVIEKKRVKNLDRIRREVTGYSKEGVKAAEAGKQDKIYALFKKLGVADEKAKDLAGIGAFDFMEKKSDLIDLFLNLPDRYMDQLEAKQEQAPQAPAKFVVGKVYETKTGGFARREVDGSWTPVEGK